MKRKGILLIVALSLLIIISAGFILTAILSKEDVEPFVEQDLSGLTNYEYARATAAQGMVLLKNSNNSLPLKNDKIAVFGMNQVDYIPGGGGSAGVNSEYLVSLQEGLNNKEAEGKISIFQPLAEAYASEYDKKSNNPVGRIQQMNIDDNLFNDAVEFANTAIISIGRFIEEGTDAHSTNGRYYQPNDYYLTNTEQILVDKVCEAGFAKVVVVLNIGSVIDSTWFKDNDKIDAVLLAWHGGMEGGNAMADILCGDVNPSGKLPTTFAKAYTDYPSSSTFHESQNYVNYYEDIYVGYRYFETIPGAKEKVNYEFGYGLSYTEFKTSKVKTSIDDKNVNITATVKNTGTTSGKEILQVYYSAPQGKLGKSAKELATFAKTKELNPNESTTLTFSFPISDMASYDDTGKSGHQSSYILEEGEYKFYVGNSIRNVTECRKKYKVKETTVIETLSQQLPPIELSKRLLSDGTYEELNVEINNAAKICTVPPAGSVKLEGEDYIDKDETIAIEIMSDANGDAGFAVSYFNQNAWLEYKLDVKEAGTYYVKLLAANGHGMTISDFLNVYVNGAPQDINLTINDTSTASNQWHSYMELEPFQIELSEGESILKLECSKPTGPNLDYMIIQNTVDNSVTQNYDDKEKTQDQEKDKPEDVQKNLNDSERIMLKDVYENPEKMDSFIAQLTDQELINLSGGPIGNLSKYGVTTVNVADGAAGLHADIRYKATYWPCATLLASTWDTTLVEQVGKRVGDEFVKSKIDLLLAPSLNIQRDPLCGRNFEYYSEDPLISGKMAAAYTRGIQSKNVGVAIKHFALNNKEDYRRISDSRVSERAAREIYLKGFKIVVDEADPWSIMSSYNLINGTKAAHSVDLLTNILSDEWGYEGLVMTDWDNAAIHYLEAIAGNDVKMPQGDRTNLSKKLKDENSGLTRDVLERNVKHVLELVMKSNSFLDKYVNAD